MPLSLKSVEPSRGMRWIADAAKLFAKRPVAFMALFALFGLWMVVTSLLPFVGLALQLMSLPVLSLGYMVAAQSALLDGPVHPRHFVEPFRSEPKRRSALIKVCASYSMLSVATIWLANALSDGGLTVFHEFSRIANPSKEQIQAVMADARVWDFFSAFSLLVAVLSVPYWHAAALVHWGGQGAGQAVFSSVLALWRNKGAFLVYSLGWLGMGVLGGMLSMLAISMAGLALGAVVLLSLMLAGSALFYVSQLFIFNDSFGGSPVVTDDDPLTQPDL